MIIRTPDPIIVHLNLPPGLPLPPYRATRQLDPSRGVAMSPASAANLAAPTAHAVAGQGADDDVEEGDNAVDNSHDDAANAVNNGHEHGADGPEDGLDAGHNSAHFDGLVWFAWEIGRWWS